MYIQKTESKNLRYYFLIFLFAILLTGCNIISYYQQDPFYRNGSEFDHLRFPLIKPYYAIYITDQYGWGIPLESSPANRSFYYYLQINNVQKIAVEKGVIMVYTPAAQQVDESVGQKILYWFVFIPDKNIEMGFDKEAEFLSYIQISGIQAPLWREPKNILQEYDQTWCLDWIPACQ